MIVSSLDEYTRKRLLDKSKKDTPDRFQRRNDLKDKWELKRVGLLELTASDDLYLYFDVNGYQVALKVIGYKPILQKYLNGKFGNDVTKAVKKSIDYALRYNHIQVACKCADFKYRYAYMATMKGYGLDTNETRPANIRNPKNKGGLCKHQIRILSSPSLWIPKVIPAIRNYIKISEKGD